MGLARYPNDSIRLSWSKERVEQEKPFQSVIAGLKRAAEGGGENLEAGDPENPERGERRFPGPEAVPEMLLWEDDRDLHL